MLLKCASINNRSKKIYFLTTKNICLCYSYVILPSKLKKQTDDGRFFFKFSVMIDTCSIKCSVSLARKKIRLDFQSMEALGQKMTSESKEDA